MYQVKLYRNTGFNAINIPDSPSLLPEADAYSCPALDIYQARELSQFSIRISPGKYHEIQDADYLYLQNDQVASDFAYYSVQNITMTSNDVAVVHCTMDYILTAGGVRNNNLEFLDGICERHHVTVAEDKFGAFDEADPYLTPAEMMRIEEYEPQFWGANDRYENATILESTIALEDIEDYLTSDLAGLDYSSTNGNICTVPTPPTVSDDIVAKMATSDPNRPYIASRLPKVGFYLTGGESTNPNQHIVYNQNISWLYLGVGTPTHPSGLGAIAKLRGLSMESGIIAQYAIPAYMINLTGVFKTGNIGIFTSLEGKRIIVGGQLPFKHPYTHTVRNNRIYYGDNCSYHIVSLASGNEAKFLPEEIYDYEHEYTSPTVEMRVDPRPKGCPYFRFDIYRGKRDSNLFFTNAVKGLEWQNVPLIYEGGSGSLINQYKFDSQQAINAESMQYSLNQNAVAREQANVHATAGIAGNLLGTIGDTVTGNLGGILNNVGDALATYWDQGYINQQYDLSSKHAQDSYMLQRRSELGSLLIQNSIKAPSMNFPISEGIRDYVGNTCLVYRTYYTENDVARIDKILTMYGYKHTTPISNNLLTNRSKFNYIEARAVSIGNKNLPKWIRDGVAMQFASGVRIWHVAPDPACYTDGTNT